MALLVQLIVKTLAAGIQDSMAVVAALQGFFVRIIALQVVHHVQQLVCGETQSQSHWMVGHTWRLQSRHNHLYVSRMRLPSNVLGARHPMAMPSCD